MGRIAGEEWTPDPFHLRFIEIGNENGCSATSAAPCPVRAHYKPLYDAIKSRYPTFRRRQTRGPFPIDILDDHYYNSPGWFWPIRTSMTAPTAVDPESTLGNMRLPRSVGRNLRAALAEAAFMTGMERNSDVVTMSSYAPLFVNVNDRKWNPNAIVFNGASSYGTPSYHVQKVFSQNRPDVNFG